MMDKYCIYLRKSRKDIEAEKFGEGETLAKHKNILEALAVKNELFIENIFSEVVSGETIKDRPMIKQLINDCYDGKYRGILVVDISRLSRGNQGDAQIILDCLKYGNKNKGVLVITPTKVYDIANNYDDYEYMEFELFMSRREYKMINKRQQRGKLQAIVEGNYMASYRPYGWNIKKTKLCRTLEPNPTEIEWVKKIYEWRINDNLTDYSIAKKLQTLGAPTYHKGNEWTHTTVKDIIRNPVNNGKVRWNDRKLVKSMVDGELVSTRPRTHDTNSYMLYEGKHMKLIDDDTFQEANMVYRRDKTKSGLKLINPLASLLVCKKCGKAMEYKAYKHKENVAPRFTHKSQSTCKVKSVKVEDVINALISSLELCIDDFTVKANKLPSVNKNDVEWEIKACKTEIAKIEKRLSKLFEAWEDETITDNEFIERKTLNKQKIDSLNMQIKNLQKSIPQTEKYDTMIVSVHEAIKMLQDDTIEAKVKNDFLKTFIKKIEFSYENENNFSLDLFFKE